MQALLAKPTAEQAQLLTWFQQQVRRLQEQRRTDFTSALAKRSAAFAQVQKPKSLSDRRHLLDGPENASASS